MKVLIIAIVIIVILGAFGYFIFAINQTKTEEPAAITQNNTQPETDTENAKKEEITQPKTGVPESNSVTFTDSGVSPSSIVIKSGETIKWVNNSSSTIQIGSNNHPTHTVNQELTGGSFVIELAPGESQTVQLSKTGDWGYHDHLKPSVSGAIIIE